VEDLVDGGGNSKAMHEVGLCYDYGEGTDENKTKAFEWYEKSAHLGNCEAMNNLGEYYHDGKGGTIDFNKTREWFTKSAAQGNSDAQHTIYIHTGKNNRCCKWGMDLVDWPTKMEMEWLTEYKRTNK